jgi:hypothetical protein
MRALPSDGVGTAFRVELAERWETQERTKRALMYRMFGQIADPPDQTAMAPMVVNSLAARLRIAPSEAKRRMRVAARIQPRRQLTGPELAPELPLVAAALEAGTIGEDHLRVICRALDTLPSCVSPMDRDDVQASLLRQASKSDAEIVKAVARRIEEIFNPDSQGVQIAWSETSNADDWSKNMIRARCEGRYATIIFAPLGVVVCDLTA